MPKIRNLEPNNSAVLQKILEIKPLYRLLLSAGVAAAGAGLPYQNDFSPLLRFVFGWCVFATIFLTLEWLIIIKRPTSRIREIAAEDDGNRMTVLLIIGVASLATLMVVLALPVGDQKPNETGWYFLPLIVYAMISSWAIIHTHFTFHYAHRYYAPNEEGAPTRGLIFPGEEKNPDYLDFAYYSLCMGTTFQVSDISTSSKSMRHLTMLHGLLAFFLNTFVVALTINLVAGLWPSS